MKKQFQKCYDPGDEEDDAPENDETENVAVD